LKIASVLEELGFNIQLLGSEKYVLNKLKSLNAEDVARIREAFIKNKAPRFMKYFYPHQPYGKQKLYVEKLLKASLKRLAHLIKVCSLLLQTKVYSFWNNQ
jgi:hypothetical protein